MASTDKVFIKNLTLTLSVGIYDHEKAAKQRVILNAVFDVPSNERKSLASIEDVFSYERAVQDIRKIAESRHYELLEQLAEDIALQLSRDQKVKALTLSLEKPDIIPGAEGVGVEITRIFG